MSFAVVWFDTLPTREGLFSRSGFKADVAALAEADTSIKLITPQMMLEPTGPGLDLGDDATQRSTPGL